jgi:hypothetical protein
MAHVALLSAQGAHQVLMAGAHGAAGALLLDRQPGQDAALQNGTSAQGRRLPLRQKGGVLELFQGPRALIGKHI